MATTGSVFFLREARELDVERDVLLALPPDTSANPRPGGAVGTFFRVPIRSSWNGENGATRRYVPNSRHVLETASGLRRLLVRFPESFCSGVRSYENNDNALTIGFPLFAHRIGPTAAERETIDRLDRVAQFVAESGPPLSVHGTRGWPGADPDPMRPPPHRTEIAIPAI